MSLAEATKVFDKLVVSKLAKGYHYSAASAGQDKPYQQTGGEGRESGIRYQLLNPIDEADVYVLIRSQQFCLQQNHDGRRLFVHKQGDTITGIKRRGLVVAIPDPIREEIEQIPFDVLIDGEAADDTLHAFDLLESNGHDTASAATSSASPG